MKNYTITTFYILTIAVFSSCITFFSPRNQKVVIQTSEPNAVIKIDNADVGSDSVLTILKKDMILKKVNISKEGFKDKHDAIYQSKVNKLLLIDIAMIPVFGLGIPGTLIDGAGTKWKSYDKMYKYNELTKLPVKKDDQKYLFVDQTSIDISTGDIIGVYYSKYKDYIAEKDGIEIEAKSDNKYENTQFTHDLNNYLLEYGFTDTSDNIIPNNVNSLFVTSEIKTMKIDLINLVVNGSDKFIIQLNLSINWIFKDIYGNKVVEILTDENSDIFGLSDDKSDIAVQDALQYSLIKVLKSESLKPFLEQSKDEENLNLEPLAIDPIKPEANQTLNDYIEACLTVKTDNGHGSGFIISEEGYIVTCYHVVAGSKELEVIFSDGKKVKAEIVRHDYLTDLALLKIDKENIKGLTVNSEKKINIGTTVYAIGTPKKIELGQSLSKGIISGKRPENDLTYIQTDVSINGGNSGGALIDENGVVIGVVNAKLSGFGIEGIGFAIPSHYIYERLKIKFK